MLSLATIFMWLALIKTMFVNLIVGQPVVFGIVGVVDDADLRRLVDEEVGFEDDYDNELQGKAPLSGNGGGACTIL